MVTTMAPDAASIADQVCRSGLDDDEALLGHLPDRPLRAFARVAAVADAAVGLLVGAEGRDLVHEHAAVVERARGFEGVVEIGGEDRGLESIPRVVREAERLVERAI